MKTSKKILAFALVLVLMLSLSVTAFAQTVTVGDSTMPGSITVTNAQPTARYELYQLFNAALENNKTVYTFKTGKTDLKATVNSVEVDGAQWFKVSDGKITKQDTLTSDVLQSADFQNWAKAYGAPALATVQKSNDATDPTLVFDKIPQGYYMITSDFNGGALVTVDTATPDVEVVDKNPPPTWKDNGKTIIENNQKVSKNEAFLDEEITFDITVVGMNYAKSDSNTAEKIHHLYVKDEIAKGMTYVGLPTSVTIGGTAISPRSASNPNGYELKYYTADPHAATDPGTEVSLVDTNGLPLQGDALQAALKTAQYFEIVFPWTDNTTVEGTPAAITAECDQNGNSLYTAGDEIVIRYKGKLDSTKVEVDPSTGEISNVDFVNANENKANFNWAQGPEDPTNPWTPTGRGGEKKTETFITKIKIWKYHVVNGQEQTLTGAQFTLTPQAGTTQTVSVTTGTHYVKYPDGETTFANGKYWLLNDPANTYTATEPDTTVNPGVDLTKYVQNSSGGYDIYGKENYQIQDTTKTTPDPIVVWVDDDGYATFNGLSAGTYVLTETVTPAGYVTMDPVTYEITWNGSKLSVVNSELNIGDTENKVENRTGTELPETGGIGTTMFYIIGSMLLLGAVVLLVTRKRMGHEA